MNSKLIQPLVFSLFLGGILLSCSEKKDDPHAATAEQLDRGSSDIYCDYSQVRSLDRSASSPSPSRYLGRGFNLIKYERNDPEGFAFHDVLDLKRIQSQDPWNPFSRSGIEDVLEPELLEREGSSEPFSRILNSKAEHIYNDTITLSLGAAYKESKIGYSHSSYTNNIEKSLVYRVIYGIKYKWVGWEVSTPSDYEFYLSRRFVRDLKLLSASELVSKYGTHIVTSYSLGAFQDLSVIASSSSFTQADIEDIHADIISGKISGAHHSARKAISNRHQVAIIYRQAGSTYIPPQPFISPNLFFREDKDIAPLDQVSFMAQASKERNAFFELEGNNVSIPDLISDIPLKVKYLSGILDQVRPANVRVTRYVLCDPATYKPIKAGAEYLAVYLKSYKDAQVHVFLGDSTFDMINDPESSQLHTTWRAQLDGSGLWMFKTLHSEKYLCRDLKIRTSEEDTAGLRYWGLNPIPHTSSRSSASLAGLLIQTK